MYSSSSNEFERIAKSNCIDLVKPALSSADINEINRVIESKLANPVNKTVQIKGVIFVEDTPRNEPTQVSCQKFIGVNPESINAVN